MEMKLAVYNPHDLPVEELPCIYGFNNGGSPGWYIAALVAQDGTILGSHGCSAEGYIPGDLGLLEGTREDRHEGFRKHYPDGYRMVYIPLAQVPTHKGLAEAAARHQEQAAKEEKVSQ